MTEEKVKLNNSEKYTKLAQEYNLQKLDSIYNELINTGSEAEKRELYEYGFQELLNWMNYDFACGKLDIAGIELMADIVEKAENLVNHKLWYDRGLSFMNMMTAYLVTDLHKVKEYGKAGIEAFTLYIEEKGELSLLAWSHLSEIYESFIKFFPESRTENLKNSVSCLHQIIETSPFKVPWFTYLKLLYLDYPDEDESFQKLRLNEREIFHDLCLNIYSEKNEFADELALSYKRFMELLSWKDTYSGLFPETDYLCWLEKSRDSIVSGSYLHLTEMGSLFFNEGKRLKRKDLLLASIERYRQLIAIDSDKPSFPIMYVACAMEELANQYREDSKPDNADEYLNSARRFYLSYYDEIKANFSVLVHYGEFLERCLYEYKGSHIKPCADEILEIAKLAEKEGRGYYAGPEMLLTRFALRTGNTYMAIFYITRLLLLHELCIENDLKKLRECSFCAENSCISNFIDENLRFMESIREGYYLDGTLSWEKMEGMSLENLTTTWEARKFELAKREKLKFDLPDSTN